MFEDRAVKEDVDPEGRGGADTDAIFASNTSTLPITALAENRRGPKNFIGIHFFSPVDRMMLVEIIMGKKTGDKALAAAIDYVRAIRKTPIVVNDTRGFYSTARAAATSSEGHQMLTEGVPAAMIENAAQDGRHAGRPAGAHRRGGDRPRAEDHEATGSDLGDKAVTRAQMELIDAMVDKHGRLGRKNGKGFYDYPAEARARSALAGPQRSLPADSDPDDDRRRRVEAALPGRPWRWRPRAAWKKGVVTDLREADVGSILGFGFAPFTGGTLSYIDFMGAKAFVRSPSGLREGTAPQFKPPKLPARHGEKGETFYRPLRRTERSRREGQAA